MNELQSALKEIEFRNKQSNDANLMLRQVAQKLYLQGKWTLEEYREYCEKLGLTRVGAGKQK